MIDILNPEYSSLFLGNFHKPQFFLSNKMFGLMETEKVAICYTFILIKKGVKVKKVVSLMEEESGFKSKISKTVCLDTNKKNKIQTTLHALFHPKDGIHVCLFLTKKEEFNFLLDEANITIHKKQDTFFRILPKKKVHRKEIDFEAKANLGV